MEYKFEKVNEQEKMISILNGSVDKIKEALISLGVDSKNFKWKYLRKDYEELYILKVGLDKIIKADKEIRSANKKNGKKVKYKYANTLKLMRYKRGEEFVNSPEYKKYNSDMDIVNSKELSRYLKDDIINYLQKKALREPKEIKNRNINKDELINYLCGNIGPIMNFLALSGIMDSKEIKEASEQEIQEIFISEVGLDIVIEADLNARAIDKVNNNIGDYKYEDTLKRMRYNRGKSIVESDEFQKLKTDIERMEFLRKFGSNKYIINDVLDYLKEKELEELNKKMDSWRRRDNKGNDYNEKNYM